MSDAPVPFQVYKAGTYLHGTKADLAPGDLLVPGHASNYEDGRVSRNVYVSETLDAAVWAAELAVGDGPGASTSSSRPVRSRTIPTSPTRSCPAIRPARTAPPTPCASCRN